MSASLFEKYVAVVLEISIDQKLDYGVPSPLINKIRKGMRVEVPVRGFPRTGYIYAIKDKPDFPSVKPITRILSEQELLSEELFELALWMAKYYCAALRDVFTTILPASIRKDTQHKQQLFVMRGKTREILREICGSLRNKHPAQAAVLDQMLQVKKGILLSELLEKTGGSRSPVDTLAKKGILVLDVIRVDRSPLINEEYFQTKPKKLNDQQAKALEKIALSINENRFETHLLHGITGSGKTEVYLQAIEKTLAKGKGTIMLVPEISLTGQTIERFRSRFEGHIAILHHRLSQGERFDEWHKIKRGDAKIVIGARSAVFSPVANLGLIIVDEEHEQSYKQSEESPCYHARDIAVLRGRLSTSCVILGSATPSLESYHNALSGKYTLSQLQIRADAASLPQVHIVDMRIEYQKSQGYTNFSEHLLDGIKKRQKQGEQTILFLNRRGYHTTLLCPTCQTTVRCNHCDVSLTFHYCDNILSCHLCGYTLAPPPKNCPCCKSPDPMKFRGVGTEQIERSLHAIFPDIRTLRIDADTTKHKGSHQKLLKEFGTGKADVLIGTQMIAKGLHFPEVTLVGVLNCDSSLNIPDFRASETTFQLMTQVAGRAGRGAISGEVIIQTCMPDNSTILLASQQNFEEFYKNETSIRKLFHYPPFQQMAKISFSGADQKETEKYAQMVYQRVKQSLPKEFETHPVLPAGYVKVKDLYRYQFLIRGPSVYPISHALDHIRIEKKNSKIKMFVDINPSSTFF